MSPIKRTRRATAKQHAGRGRHARTVETVMPAPRWPQVADVPPELASQEYEFPTVALPQSRPGVGRQVLAELTADDDTQPIDLTDMVVDPTPRPAEAEGLIPVPSPPFLNAGAQEPLRNGEQFAPHDEPEPGRPYVTVGNALPTRMTAWELELLQRPVGEILGDPDDMPTWPQPAVRHAEPPRPQQRDETHPLVFSVFDTPFWNAVNEAARQREMAAATREGDTDAGIEQLLTRLARLDAAHQQFITAVAAEEYRGRLADSIRPLPHRVPGAALAAIEAAELVSA